MAVTLTSATLWSQARMEEVDNAIVDMEHNGFALDVDYCARQAARAQADETVVLNRLTTWLTQRGYSDEDALDFNWASPKQLVELFHGRLGLPPSPVWKKGRVKVDQGDRKLDETALEWLREKSPEVIKEGIDDLLLLRRTRGSIKYLTKLPNYVAPDGFVHAVSGPSSDVDPRAGTITWRLASKNPEILQIPTDPKKDAYAIRRAFVAPPGYTLIAADETALEAVILAHLFIKLFDDHQLADLLVPGADLHAFNAKRIFGTYLKWTRYGHQVDQFPDAAFKSDDYPELQYLRQMVKSVWYGLMYGKSAYGFATSLRDSEGNPIGQETAEKIVAALYEALPALPRYSGFILEYVQTHHGIPGLGGAWCDLSELTRTGNKWDLARAHRIAQNYPCQEGGARIIGHSMVEIASDPESKRLGLLLERQVHDELDFRVPDENVEPAKALVLKHMTSYPLETLLQVSIGSGQTWADC